VHISGASCLQIKGHAVPQSFHTWFAVQSHSFSDLTHDPSVFNHRPSGHEHSDTHLSGNVSSLCIPQTKGLAVPQSFHTWFAGQRLCPEQEIVRNASNAICSNSIVFTANKYL